jgi:hypothetical protein
VLLLGWGLTLVPPLLLTCQLQLQRHRALPAANTVVDGYQQTIGAFSHPAELYTVRSGVHRFGVTQGWMAVACDVVQILNMCVVNDERVFHSFCRTSDMLMWHSQSAQTG